MSNPNLTERQRTILEMIRESVAGRGYPPSIREIGEAVGLTSPSSVAYQLQILERKGYLRRDPHRPRAMEVLHPDGQQAGGSHLSAVADRDAEAQGGPMPRDRRWEIAGRPHRGSAADHAGARSRPHRRRRPILPNRRLRRCFRCRPNLWARATCSCCGSWVILWSTRGHLRR